MDSCGYQGTLKQDVFCHRKPCVTMGVTDVELQHHEQDNGSGVTHWKPIAGGDTAPIESDSGDAKSGLGATATGLQKVHNLK